MAEMRDFQALTHRPMAHHLLLYDMQTKNDFYVSTWLEKKVFYVIGNDTKIQISVSINKALLGCCHALWAMGNFALQGEPS